MLNIPNNNPEKKIYNNFKNKHQERLKNIFKLNKLINNPNEINNISKGYTSFIFNEFEKYRNQELLQSSEYIEKLLKNSFNSSNFNFNPYIIDYTKNPDFRINPYIQKQIADNSLLYIGIFPYKEDKNGLIGKIYWGIFGYENWALNSNNYTGHLLAKYFILLSLGLRNYFVKLGWFDINKYIDTKQIIKLQKKIYTPNFLDLINKFKKENIDPNLLYQIEKQILDNLLNF